MTRYNKAGISHWNTRLSCMKSATTLRNMCSSVLAMLAPKAKLLGTVRRRAWTAFPCQKITLIETSGMKPTQTCHMTRHCKWQTSLCLFVSLFVYFQDRTHNFYFISFPRGWGRWQAVPLQQMAPWATAYFGHANLVHEVTFSWFSWLKLNVSEICTELASFLFFTYMVSSNTIKW